MNKFSLGIVGAGAIVQNSHLPVLVNLPNLKIDWIADIDNNRAKLLANAYSIPHIKLPEAPDKLPDCDVVLLAIPLLPRRLYYEMLSKRGISIFAEKPFALNSNEHSRLQSLFEPHKIGCGYMRRMYSTNQLLRRLIKESWFGPLRRIQIREGDRITKTGINNSYQDLNNKEGGGILINLGCHALDTAFYITGAKEFSVNKKDIVFDNHTDRKANGQVTFSSLFGQKNTMCEVDFCLSWLDRQKNTIELIFDNLTLISPIAPGGTIDILYRNQGVVSAQLNTRINNGATTSVQAFYLEWKEFLRGLEECRPSLMAAVSAEITAQLIDELLK